MDNMRHLILKMEGLSRLDYNKHDNTLCLRVTVDQD